MAKTVKLCNSDGSVMHVLPREQDLVYEFLNFDSLIEEFLNKVENSEVYPCSYREDKQEGNSDVAYLFFSLENLANVSELVWNFMIRKATNQI